MNARDEQVRRWLEEVEKRQARVEEAANRARREREETTRERLRLTERRLVEAEARRDNLEKEVAKLKAKLNQSEDQVLNLARKIQECQLTTRREIAEENNDFELIPPPGHLISPSSSITVLDATAAVILVQYLPTRPTTD